MPGCFLALQFAEAFQSFADFFPSCLPGLTCGQWGDGAVGAPQVACGARHTLALTQRGAAFATGWNCFGQLGVGARDRTNRRTATRVAGPWNLRGAQHAVERACAASACSAGWACGGEPRGRLHGADAAGCGAEAGKPSDVKCRDTQGQAEVVREGIDQGSSCADTAHEQLAGGAGGKLQDVRVLDVVCGWWHSLFIVELV